MKYYMYSYVMEEIKMACKKPSVHKFENENENKRFQVAAMWALNVSGIKRNGDRLVMNLKFNSNFVCLH